MRGAGIVLACGMSMTLAAAAQASVKVKEAGFGVTPFNQCGYDGPQSGPQSQRPPRATINDLQCSPGGAFGDYVYVAVRTVDRNFDTIGGVERVTFTGASSLAPPGLVSNYYATNISFTPAGWRGGDLIEVTMKGDPSSTGGDSFVEPFDAAWAAQGTRGFRFGTDAATAVDPTGGFSSDLFFEASDGYDGSGSTFVPGGIYRIDSAGVESLFGPPRFDEMRFGRGGAWGSDLYVDGESFSPNGTSTPLGTVFREFDWADGPGFNGDMFAHVAGQDPGTVFRITPGGTATVFATGAPGQIAGCNGSLWIANQSGCFVVTKKGH